MALSDVTSDSVLLAVAEFKQLGRDAFVKKYGFRRARGYYLVIDGEEYDSKAILGAAHGHLGNGSVPLGPKDFSGGDRRVVPILEGKLGFRVRTPHSPDTRVIPFVPGGIYNRQAHIHERYAGQERGGIATPAGVPYVFLFTGESGEQYGYRDGWRDDGTFSYCGEGQQGDQEFVRGNRAVRDHRDNGRELLLFEATNKDGFHRFVGVFSFHDFHPRMDKDKNGHDRQLIIFQLSPETSVDFIDPSLDQDFNTPLDELRQRAYAAAANDGRGKDRAPRHYYERSRDVSKYVLRRAAGKCEACLKPAPFTRKNGTPYLEPHHTERVADGGPDHPRSVGAVCPACHRQIHYGVGGDELNEQLMDYLEKLEGMEA